MMLDITESLCVRPPRSQLHMSYDEYLFHEGEQVFEEALQFVVFYSTICILQLWNKILKIKLHEFYLYRTRSLL